MASIPGNSGDKGVSADASSAEAGWPISRIEIEIEIQIGIGMKSGLQCETPDFTGPPTPSNRKRPSFATSGTGTQASLSPESPEAAGLYVHVPFCSGKCAYCDFYSITDLARVEDWLKAVIREARLAGPAFDRFDTIYLGGGTPSILGERVLTRLLEGLRRELRFTSKPEITLEANPENVHCGSLAAFRRAGIHRMSLGIQSLDSETLRVLGRRHTAGRAEQALKEALDAGFVSVGADLIYGVPGQTPSRWMEGLESVLRIGPHHISCYELTLSPHTALGRRHATGRFPLPDDDTLTALFLQTSRCLQREGYVHYEVSNYARPGHESRHNRKYWRRVPYLGLGPAAHSFRPPTRWWNPHSVDTYCNRLARNRRPEEGRETLTEDQEVLERLGLGFRTREGVDVSDPSLGVQADRLATELEQAGLVLRRGSRVCATIRGYLVADSLPLLFMA